MDEHELHTAPVAGREPLDLVGEVMRVDDDAVDALALEVAKLSGQERLAADIDEDLRNVQAKRIETSAAPGAEDHRVHGRQCYPRRAPPQRDGSTAISA